MKNGRNVGVNCFFSRASLVFALAYSGILSLRAFEFLLRFWL